MSHTYVIVAKTSILHVPEHYPSFNATGLPFRPRFVSPVLVIPNEYIENAAMPVLEFSLFAKMLNGSVNDTLQTDAFDMRYRLASRVEMKVVSFNGRLSVVVTPDLSGQLVHRDRGVERTPLGTFVPPPLRVEEVSFKLVSPTRFEFSWLVLGRPHWLAEPLFEEVCHRDCVYIWHKVAGQITLEKDLYLLKASMTASRFPSHALFVNQQRKIFKPQGALGNLWVSDGVDRKRVSSTGPSEYVEPPTFGGGSSGGAGAGGNW